MNNPKNNVLIDNTNVDNVSMSVHGRIFRRIRKI